MPPICGKLVRKGFCTQAGCARRHPDVCDVCDGIRIVDSNPNTRDQHYLSKKHLRFAYERGVVDNSRCSICADTVFRNQFEFIAHYITKGHRKRAKARGVSPYAALAPDALRHCHPCNRLIRNQNWPSHLLSASHLQKSAKHPTPASGTTDTSTRQHIGPDPVDLGYVTPHVEALVFRIQVRLPEGRDGGHTKRVSLSSAAQSA